MITPTKKWALPNVLFAASLACSACSAESSGLPTAGGDKPYGSSSGGAPTLDAGMGSGGFPNSAGTGGALALDAGGSADAGGQTCVPPDLLMVVDRTTSMHERPDGVPAENTPSGKLQSKWYIAIDAVKWLADHGQQGIRFGLELFPRDPGVGCVTLGERIDGQKATNPPCEPGEVLVAPKLDAANDIDSMVDPDVTKLCVSTPIGAALDVARSSLSLIHEATRPQYALLITDGQDSCDAELMLASARALAADGVKLHVVGFDALVGTGVSNYNLNQLACAARTATGFPATCVDDGAGNFSAKEPDGPALYYVAQTGAALDELLVGIAQNVCCNCGTIPVQPPPA